MGWLGWAPQNPGSSRLKSRQAPCTEKQEHLCSWWLCRDKYEKWFFIALDQCVHSSTCVEEQHFALNTSLWTWVHNEEPYLGLTAALRTNLQENHMFHGLFFNLSNFPSVGKVNKIIPSLLFGSNAQCKAFPVSLSGVTILFTCLKFCVGQGTGTSSRAKALLGPFWTLTHTQVITVSKIKKKPKYSERKLTEILIEKEVK